MRQEHFYTLLCSLPYLPHFLKAKQLPISSIGLEKRIDMLPAKQRMLSQRILENLEWYYFPKLQKSADIVSDYETLLELSLPYPELQRTIQTIMERRIITTAYRIGLFGIQTAEQWRITPLMTRLGLANSTDSLRLEKRFPWVKELKRCLAEEAPYDLTLILMELDWKEANRLAFAYPFGFEAFSAYLFRWMILQMWLGFDTQKAANRFTTLTSEIVSEYKHQHPLFD